MSQPNTYHCTIKMKSTNVQSSKCIDFGNKTIMKKETKFKVDDHVRTSKYENIFAKSYVLNWSDEVFVIKKI